MKLKKRLRNKKTWTILMNTNLFQSANQFGPTNLRTFQTYNWCKWHKESPTMRTTLKLCKLTWLRCNLFNSKMRNWIRFPKSVMIHQWPVLSNRYSTTSTRWTHKSISKWFILIKVKFHSKIISNRTFLRIKIYKINKLLFLKINLRYSHNIFLSQPLVYRYMFQWIKIIKQIRWCLRNF